MRRPPRNSLLLRIKLLDQQRLIRLHPRRIVPLVLPVCFDLPRLRPRPRREVVAVLGSDQCLGEIRVQSDQVLLLRCSSVTTGEVVASHGVKGAPEVDDCPAGFLEFFGVRM